MLTSFLVSKFSGYLVIGSIILAIVGGLYIKYKFMESTIATLEKNAIVLETAVSTQKETIQVAEKNAVEWEKARDKAIQDLASMQSNYLTAKQEKDKLYEIFNKHNLAKLSKRKPGLIEKRINGGSRRIVGMLICASAGGKDCPDKTQGATKSIGSPKP